MTLLDRADLEGPSSELPASTATLRPWLLAWLGLPILGIANGAIREVSYKRVAGELAAHQLSTATLLVLMATYLWALERRWPLQRSRRALTIGGSWAVLTILFEFGFGRYAACLSCLAGSSVAGCQSTPESSSGRSGTLTRGVGFWSGPSVDHGSSNTHEQQLLPDASDAVRPGG
jgi:hypothetical protein